MGGEREHHHHWNDGESMTDNGDGTVTDPATGLMWEQAGSSERFTHAAAIQRCTGLTLAGHTDWRLPTRAELASLVDDKRYQPAIDPVIAGESAGYWSATTYQYGPSYAWLVNFTGGFVLANFKSSNGYVRGVRGGSLTIRPFDKLEAENTQLRVQLAEARTWMQHRLKESAHLMHTQACAIQSPKAGFALGRCTCGLRELLADLDEEERP